MSIINIDDRLNVDNQATVKLAGQEYHLVFNDEFRQKSVALDAKVTKLINKLTDDKFNKEIELLPADKQKEKITSLMSQIKKVVCDGLDDLLGEGVGQKIYDYYHQSTDAVSAVIGVLVDASDNAVKVKENKNRAQRRAKYRKER